MSVIRSLVIPLLLLSLLEVGCAQTPAIGSSGGKDEDLRVLRGDFQERLHLTGEVEAAGGDTIVVPRIPSWQTTIKWIVEDGSSVKKGERLLELDSTQFSSDLSQRRLSLADSEQTLAQQRERLSAEIQQREFELEKKSVELEKARLDAEVPEDIVARREYQNRQLALKRAEVELEKARTELESRRTAARSDLQNLELDLEKKRGEILLAESAIEALEITAPGDGIVVVSNNPRSGRKLQVGDNVFVGWPVMKIPDMRTLQIIGVLHDVDDGRIASDQLVEMSVDAFPQKSFTGKVASITSIAQELSSDSLRKSFRVRIVPDEVDTELLRPGYSVRASVLSSSLQNVLLAPRICLDLSASPARARTGGGKLVDVVLGGCNSTHCVVESGLEEGQLLSRLETGS